MDWLRRLFTVEQAVADTLLVVRPDAAAVEMADRDAIRAELGYWEDGKVCNVAVGGSGVRAHLLRATKPFGRQPALQISSGRLPGVPTRGGVSINGRTPRGQCPPPPTRVATNPNPRGAGRRRSAPRVPSRRVDRPTRRTILERAGYRVRVAGDGREALALLAEQRSDLVLTEVEMPTMDGFALTAAITAHPGLSKVPVLILTSRSSNADRLRGLEAGADGYVVNSAFDEHGLLTDDRHQRSDRGSRTNPVGSRLLPLLSR